jgi:glutamate carboxypeptidase
MRFTRELDWIDAQATRMTSVVEEWAGISSASFDRDGLGRMTATLERALPTLGGLIEVHELPAAQIIDGNGRSSERALGKALRIVKRPEHPRRVFLGIHSDTVHPADRSPRVERTDSGTLRGPGVADAKGGLAVLWVALEAFERSALADSFGWEVLINPDEELGSPGSASLLSEAARRSRLGLLFEPALPGGALASARKGSGNFTAIIRGRAAHAGRDFEIGRNAVIALADLALRLDRLSGTAPGLTVNVGRVEGGGAVNVVPDLAICRFNVRCETAADQLHAEHEIRRAANDVASSRNGITVELDGGFSAPPKPLDGTMQALLGEFAACGRELGFGLTWQATGGVCDGNRLAAEGLPTIDSLGPRGGGIHSFDEYVVLESLPERAKLTALFLLKLAAGEIAWPARLTEGGR